MDKQFGFMFAGQGAQAPGMGADLVEVSDAAKRIFKQADAVLGWSVSEVCFNGPAAKLTESKICQPAIYTASIACFEAFKERTGAAPAACGGLSLGEFAAATAAGVFDFETGLKLVARRGQLMQDVCRDNNGTMAAVINSGRPLLDKICSICKVDIANLNCPGQIVISGAQANISNAIEALKKEGVSRVMPLDVDGAFHSHLMQPAADKFAAVLDEVDISPPQCIFVQNFTGKATGDTEEIRQNLKRQVTGTVHWEQCVRTMISNGVDMLIEFGPGKVLSGFMRRIDRQFAVANVGNADDLNETIEII